VTVWVFTDNWIAVTCFASVRVFLISTWTGFYTVYLSTDMWIAVTRFTAIRISLISTGTRVVTVYIFTDVWIAVTCFTSVRVFLISTGTRVVTVCIFTDVCWWRGWWMVDYWFTFTENTPISIFIKPIRATQMTAKLVACVWCCWWWRRCIIYWSTFTTFASIFVFDISI
jgi:hypothetical protein